MNLRVSDFVQRDGRLFASVGTGRSVATNQSAGFFIPELALDNQLLTSIAKSSGLVDNLSPEQKPLLYRVFMNEVGEIVAIEQMRGPKIPALENELKRTRVISPGRRGADPVPVVFYVEVSVP
ncbi:MAG TPA: hypothetical protein VE398_15525 [Acidobacteriota bacterium]|nr:hypothetical protein [Acidobacteriota bacterium]